MLSKTIQQALNDQIAEEAHASNDYLSMASWCEKTGYAGSAKFLYQHSENERSHMMKLFTYVNAAGGHALAPALKEPPHEFQSLMEVFHSTFKHERAVTATINDLVDLCLKGKDYSTFNFLQWYVAEQHEEERLFKSILDMIKIAGEGKDLFFVDKEIGSLAAQPKA